MSSIDTVDAPANIAVTVGAPLLAPSTASHHRMWRDVPDWSANRALAETLVDYPWELNKDSYGTPAFVSIDFAIVRYEYTPQGWRVAPYSDPSLFADVRPYLRKDL